MNALLPILAIFAGPSPTTTSFQNEIDSLLVHLKKSGCQFQRNGSWYDATTATEHLQKKREYLTRKDKLKSAEDFVLLGASTSSMSGKDYAVKCADGKLVASKLWLLRELKSIRSSPSK